MTAGKVGKASVSYRLASLADPGRRCGSCSMYRVGGSCTLVSGVIVPVGLCDRWAARRGPARRP